jgi:hypothetical protein
MKRMLMWLFMLWKRQMKKISLYVILLCMAASSFFIRHIAVNFSVNLRIGVMNEDNVGEEEAYDKKIAQNIIDRMTNHQGLVKFVQYTDQEALENDVRTSDVYAGYIFSTDFWKKVQDENLKNGIQVISTPDSIVTRIANELVFSYVMQEYTYNVLLYDTYDTGYFDEEDDEQVAEDLRKWYEENLTNGSTFSASYSGVSNYDSHVEMDIFDYISPIIKGLVGVLIFLAGLCGTLILYQDKENGTFSRFTRWQTAFISLVEIFIPVCMTSLAGMGCMLATGMNMGTLADWRHILAYMLLVVLYCFVLQLIIRKRMLFSALVPVLLMASLIFCHVFVNLTALVPEFGYIAMLLPPNYF